MRYVMPALSVNWSREAPGHVGGVDARGAVTVDAGAVATAVLVPVRLADAVMSVPLEAVDADCVIVLVTTDTELESVRVVPFSTTVVC